MKESNTIAKEKSARMVWTAFILTFFFIQACVWTFAITVTAGDNSHAVVAGYEQRGIQLGRSPSSKIGQRTSGLDSQDQH